ncbi:2-C-methyl-D-erythritol 4-phosphate cytidylyltransferase [bacterium C-53]|nr:2-C-methyl-D-erythritol 4-phosphate cytidylyltransferase [Lachnospiraceae bacterium]NBI04463.1 2-C-methyl-D-erythritol 4-phosphate cytidylyltransferase [Lachnospiraceae bacterium]RKJ08136.1 2-C-methyl-D-erythritol 4-phosphate cytidylyltransferase [bacterium C-53]
MNVALILAGGTDPRFQMTVPKQFVNVFNRPIIVYTLETFQEHPDIDSIMVSCLDGWQEMVKAYAKQFNITKLKWVITGGEDGQASARNGILALKDECRADDIVIVHDSIRPFVSEEIITDSIRVCRVNGMGVAAMRSMDTIMRTSDGYTGTDSISRYAIVRIQTPQAYRMDRLLDVHKKALEMGITGEVDTNSVVARLGEKVYFSKGSDLNLKINTLEDVEMFKALYRMQQDN